MTDTARRCLSAILGPGPDDEDIAPFLDYDLAWGRGKGFFAHDAAECASRRVDVRTPEDFDPGPIEMVEAEADTVGVVLRFAPMRPVP